MGNTLRRLCGGSFSPAHDNHHNSEGPALGNAVVYQGSPLGPHGVSIDKVGHAALTRDLFHFEITGQVPDGLSNHVQASRATQAKWYRDLLVTWKGSRPPPRNAQEAAQLVIRALQAHHKFDVEGLLSFYGLLSVPSSSAGVALQSVVIPAPAALYPPIAITTVPWPQGVQYELHTLPAESNAAVDGDTLIVYVDVANNAREAAAMPLSVQEAVTSRRTARQHRDYKVADAYQKQIIKAGYRVIDSKNGSCEILARKYRIRLRGVDAPENSMPFGNEAKAMLQSLVHGQLLHLLVYNVDQYGRLVADVHCGQGFVQEILLRNGGCWHYVAFDKREEFAKWEAEARSRRCGLWEDYNPKKPWEYRKENPRSSSN